MAITRCGAISYTIYVVRTVFVLSLFASVSTCLFMVSPAAAQDGDAFFEQSVRPVLRTNCLACHSEKTLTSGLSLETRESILRGGNRGPIVTLDKPGDSVLLQALRQTGDLKMPPGGKLKDEQIAVLEKWIAMGMPMPGASAKSKRPGSDHSGLPAAERYPLPQFGDAAWPRTALDRFVLARLEAAKLKPSPEADRATCCAAFISIYRLAAYSGGTRRIFERQACRCL